MDNRIQKILAPARAIVKQEIPTHYDAAVYPPDRKSMRTYYLFENGQVRQRKSLRYFGDSLARVATARAETKSEAERKFTAAGFRIAD